MNALGATDLVRTICATRGDDRHRGDARDLARGRPRAVAARALRGAVGLEPDVHRAAPLAAGPRGAACRRPAGGGRSLPQPHRARGRRAPGAAARHRRRAGAGDDARGRGRRARRTRSGAARTPRATTSCWSAWSDYPVERCAEICGVEAEAIERDRPRVRHHRSPALLRLGVGAQRHLGAPAAYRTVACLPALTGAWRQRRRRVLLHPDGHRGRDLGGAAPARRPAAGRACAGSTCRRSATRSPTARSTRPVKALVCWNSNPAQVAPEQAQVLAGLRRDDLFTRGAGAVHDRHRPPRRRRAARPPPRSSTSTSSSPGATTTSRCRSPRSSRVGEAKPNTEAFRLIAARMGLDDPSFSETDEQLLEALVGDGSSRA